MNKQQLASKIWESANKMRSKIEANEYKDYILGFIFYKYLSDKEVRYVYSEGGTDEDIKALSEDDRDTVKTIQKNIGYFISYDNLFSTWLDMGKDFTASHVTDALSAFSRNIDAMHKKVFDKVLDTLQTGLSKLGESSGARTKAISDLIQLIKVIPMDGRQDYDVLGFIYEYLISNFAANAGKKAGEFYTPHEVSLLMSEIIADHLKDRAEIKIYDPTSGSGSLLINIGKSVARHITGDNKIKYYAQELKENTYNLTRMNLVMRGILPDNIVTRNGDTLEEDWPYFEESDPEHTYEPLFVDAVVSNPPYSQAWDPENKEADPRFARFGIAPKSKADYAFLLHDLFHLKPDGIMTIVLPHGVLFRGGEEGAIRKNLIEHNHIDAIIGLPANVFFGTGIPTIIMVLKKNRVNNDVLIVDASRGFAKVGKNNVLRASDIKRIADTVIGRADTPKFSRVVSQKEIRANEYNLNIPRYVDSSDAAETWDIYASMFGGIPKGEAAALEKYWQTFEGLNEALFHDDGGPCFALAADDIEKTIRGHQALIDWQKKFQAAFEGFVPWLKDRLIAGWQGININREQTLIAEDLFARLEQIALVDKYNAYQALADEWAKIAIDLEILQTEGIDAARRINEDDEEGRVFPLAFIRATMLGDDSRALAAKADRLSDISAAYEEIIDSLSEDEKEKGTADDPETQKELNRLKAEEKKLKSEIKRDELALQRKSREVIQGLTDKQILEMLEEKWIAPLVEALHAIPDDVITGLVSRLRALADKYATTYADVARQIADTKASLSALIDGLTGNEYDMKGLAEFQALLRGDSYA